MKSIFTSKTFCMLIFFSILLLSFADFFINILLFEQFFPKHPQSIKLFKNPDFVSPYLGPKCLQRLSTDDKSHWKELNILIIYNNCFHILKNASFRPRCYSFVKSDYHGYTSFFFFFFFLLRHKMKVLIRTSF